MNNLEMNGFDPKLYVENLDKMPRSDGYIKIRDELKPDMIKEIKKDIETYKLFQSIRHECKQSYEYDHKTATIADVNKGLTNVYGLVLRLMKTNQGDTVGALTRLCSAINKIEEKVGLEPTDWTGGNEDVTDKPNDGESIQADNQ